MNFHDMLTVAKKDIKSCLSDKLILAQIIFLPFIIVFGYSMLMSFMNHDTSNFAKSIKAYYVASPDYMKSGLEQMGFEEISVDDIQNYKDKISDKKCDLLVVFPEDFNISQREDNLPNVEIWYTSERTESLEAYSSVCSYLSAFQPSAFVVNSYGDEKYNLGDKSAEVRNMLTMILPTMIFMAVFMVCMNLAAESVAGDKERGFLGTMLMSPVRRSSIAAGKSFAIFLASIIGGFSAFAGMALSLPRLSSSLGVEQNISYSPIECMLLFIVTITGIFALTGMLLIVSTFSRDVKQATTIAPAILMVLMIGCMLTMTDNFRDVVEEIGNWNLIIPAWNAMLVMQDIIKLEYSYVLVTASCCVNIAFALLAVLIIGKCFEDEKILN